MSNKRIVICKYCHKPELWGRMMWLDGKMECRACYKADYTEKYNEPYKWDDLDWTDEERELLNSKKEVISNAVS